MQRWGWSPGWTDEDVGGADGGVGGLVQHAGGGKHAVGVRDDGEGARGWTDEGAGGASGRGVGGHVRHAGGNKHAVGVSDDGAGARGCNDEGAGRASRGAGELVQGAGSGKHAR